VDLRWNLGGFRWRCLSCHFNWSILYPKNLKSLALEPNNHRVNSIVSFDPKSSFPVEQNPKNRAQIVPDDLLQLPPTQNLFLKLLVLPPPYPVQLLIVDCFHLELSVTKSPPHPPFRRVLSIFQAR
jgi:hypothetical protein